MDFGSLLSRAWQLTWRHKILWLFGILAGFGGGGAGNAGGGSRMRGNEPLPPDVQSQLSRSEVIAVIAVVGCIVLLIALALFVISVIARGGLIGGIRLADDNGALTFREAWAVGTRYFWRLLGIGLLLVLPGVLLALLFGTVAVLTAGIGVLCLLPLLCLVIPLFIVLAIVAHFAQFAVVLEDMGVTDAFRRGWNVLTANLANIIVVGIILFVVDFIAGFLLIVPFFAIIFPTIFLGALSRTDPNLGALGLAGLGVLCYLPIAIVLAGILHTWTTSVWTLAYRRFSGSAPAMVPPPPMPMPPQPA